MYTAYPLNVRDHCFGYPTRLLYFILSLQSIYEATDRFIDIYKLVSLYSCSLYSVGSNKKEISARG